jgi:nitrite reductase (NADH) small subunit
MTDGVDQDGVEQEFVTVARVGEIDEGTAGVYTIGERLVAVFNVGDGLYQAIDDLCPHMGASLAGGHVEEGTVMCPWHAWRFRLSDGTWCDNPRIKTDSFDVRVVGDEIQVSVNPRPRMSPKPAEK